MVWTTDSGLRKRQIFFNHYAACVVRVRVVAKSSVAECPAKAACDFNAIIIIPVSCAGVQPAPAPLSRHNCVRPPRNYASASFVRHQILGRHNFFQNMTNALTAYLHKIMTI